MKELEPAGPVPTVLQGVADTTLECRSHPARFLIHRRVRRPCYPSSARDDSILRAVLLSRLEGRLPPPDLSLSLFRQRSRLAHPSQPKNLPFTEVRVM